MVHGGEFVSVFFDQFLEFTVYEEQFRFAIGKIETDLICGQPPVDGKDDGAHSGCGSVEKKILQAVFPENTDAFALLQPEILQTTRQFFHFRFYL